MKWIKKLIPKNKKINVCLSGGVFANVKLNQRINEIRNVKNLYIHPAMGDQGLSVGVLMLNYHKLKKLNQNFYHQLL